MKEVNIDAFQDDIIIQDKLHRMRDLVINEDFDHDFKGYILETNEVDQVYKDGSGFHEPGTRTSKATEYFRPAISIKDSSLMLYLVPPFGSRGGNHHHKILERFEPIAWVFCDTERYHTIKNCPFFPYDPDTAQYMEEQYQIHTNPIKFDVKIGGITTKYTLHPTDNSEVFIQRRTDNPDRWRYVLRIPNKLARELAVKNEIRKGTSKSAKVLVDTLLSKALDVEEYDKLYDTGAYESKNYGALMKQKEIFDANFGYLTRPEAYHILSQLDALDNGIIIHFDQVAWVG